MPIGQIHLGCIAEQNHGEAKSDVHKFFECTRRNFPDKHSNKCV